MVTTHARAPPPAVSLRLPSDPRSQLPAGNSACRVARSPQRQLRHETLAAVTGDPRGFDFSLFPVGLFWGGEQSHSEESLSEHASVPSRAEPSFAAV